MERIHKNIHQFEYKFNSAIGRLVMRRPVLGFLTIFVGMPLLVLTVVCACTAAVAVPFALMFGLL